MAGDVEPTLAGKWVDPGRLDILIRARALLRKGLALDPSLEVAAEWLRRVEFEIGARQQAAGSSDPLVRPCEGLLAYAFRRGLSIHAWQPARWLDVPGLVAHGSPFVNPPQPQRIRLEARFATMVPNATFRARSGAVLDCAGGVIHDTLAHPLSDSVEPATESGLNAAAPGWICLSDLPWTESEVERAAPLVGPSSHEFGHWLSDYLPRLEALMQHPDWGRTPVFVDAGMPPSHLAALRLIIGNHPVVELKSGAQVKALQLLLAPPPVFFPFWCRSGVHLGNHVAPTDLASLQFLRARVLAALGLPMTRAEPLMTGRQRVFLCRNSSTRRWLGQAEVERQLVAHGGFVAVSPEDLSFAEQVRLVWEAEVIVGAMGSALSTVCFCRPGTLVLGMGNAQAANLASWFQALKALGIRHELINGLTRVGTSGHAHHSDYDVDGALVQRTLQALGIDPANHF